MSPHELKRLRTKAQLTQVEAACALSVYLRTYQRWESGDTPIKHYQAQLIRLTLNKPAKTDQTSLKQRV